MKKLNYQIKAIIKHNVDGSFATRSDRASNLDLIAKELWQLGYKVQEVRFIKPKHIYKLSEHWMASGLSAGTMKNRMSHLRWLMEKSNKPGVVKPRNADYGIPDRKHVNGDRSVDFEQNKIDAIAHHHVRASAELQKHFGLRREEAMKFMPKFADRGDHLVLKPSWTKGGRGRELPVMTEGQKRALSIAHSVAGSGSLIPGGVQYKTHIRVFEKQMAAVGLGKTHGARHAYAQRRYTELTQKPPAAQGGDRRADLVGFDREVDTQARLIISSELGHERPEIVAVYLGG